MYAYEDTNALILRTSLSRFYDAAVVYGYDASYEYTYKDNDLSKGIEKVTITNTPQTVVETTSVTVQKTWSGYEAGETSNYNVTVQLKETKDGVTSPKETVTLNAGNSWTYQWTELSTEYQYSVEEVQVVDTKGTEDTSDDAVVNNFDVTYSTSEPVSSGTITITNTKKSQGIVLPGTGSKYPLVFYGLGLSFLLISTIWMLLTIKKSNIPIEQRKGGKQSNK